MSKKTTLTEWCDSMVSQQKELILKWDGGDDSGWVHFEIDGEDVENEYTETLVAYMYDHLDYGSWAGEFTAQGEAIYDYDQKAFVGTDYYSESATIEYKTDIFIKVPKDIWFDELRIHIESYDGDGSTAESEFVIKNGFITERHDEVLKTLNEEFEQSINNAIDDFSRETGEDFNSIWENIEIPFNSFKVDGDYLVSHITEIPMRYREEEPKDIFLDVKQIDEQLLEN